jgi:hypothetical protein
MIARTERESNFELLRIILMIMIIGIHYLLHGGALANLHLWDSNYYTANVLQSFFIIAVNCFILISGYFGIKFRITKLLKLEFQILFYSIAIFIIFIFTGMIKLNFHELKMAVTPTFSGRWWFITVYVGLFIISPYLNLLIDKLKKDQYLKLLATLFLIFILLPTIHFNLVDVNKGQSLYSFAFLYLIGGYIKKYYSIGINKKKYLLIYFICTALIFLGNLVLTIITKRNIFMFHDYNNVLVFISSIAFFMYFKEIKIKSIKINKISSLVFGVYLIHDHHYVRNYIYSNIFHTQQLYHSNLFIIYAILSITIIFIVCTIIEYVRVKVFEKLEDWVLKRNVFKLLDDKLKVY